MTETFVKSFTYLKDMPKAGRALSMLQRVASLVKPIVRKHGWVLLTLGEFFPDSLNLLGEPKLSWCMRLSCRLYSRANIAGLSE